MKNLFLGIGLVLAILTGCAKSTQNLAAVSHFELNRYLGEWHEIARLENSFEQGLTDIRATYKMREDGKVEVINSGFNSETQKREEAIGVAHFVSAPDVADLRVSLFGPFYGGYKIIALDKQNYQYALVTSDSFDYLWILARTPHFDEPTYQMLLQKAQKLGFDTHALIKNTQENVQFRR